jgi:hypothetical protein
MKGAVPKAYVSKRMIALYDQELGKKKKRGPVIVEP